MTADQLTIQMRRLMLADYAFRQSREALLFLENNFTTLPHQLVSVTLTGACITYCRPFTQSDFYGRLGSKFERFPDNEDFQRLHDDLWRGRNWVAAHSEPEKAAELFGGQPSDLTEIGLTFAEPQGMTAFVKEPILSFDRMGRFAKMCDYQSIRVLEAFRELLPRAFKTRPRFNHRYRIGVDLPG